MATTLGLKDKKSATAVWSNIKKKLFKNGPSTTPASTNGETTPAKPKTPRKKKEPATPATPKSANKTDADGNAAQPNDVDGQEDPGKNHLSSTISSPLISCSW
jgi:hypothetical protein